MASPQRPDLNDRPSDLGPRSTSTPPARRVLRRARFVWWVIFWVGILILALWWAIWGWAGTGGWWWAGRARSATTYTPQTTGRPVMTGPGVTTLQASDKRPFVGKYFQAANVPIQSVAGRDAIWIGPDNAQPMLVILSGSGANASQVGLAKGGLVDVTGTVENAPPLAQARQQWSLTASDATRLEQQGAYIQARQVYAIHHP